MKSDSVKVIEIKEQEDGSAVLTVELDEEALHALVQEGFISIITKAVDSYNGDS